MTEPRARLRARARKKTGFALTLRRAAVLQSAGAGEWNVPPGERAVGGATEILWPSETRGIPRRWLGWPVGLTFWMPGDEWFPLCSLVSILN
jgi:hypothetical protein